MLDMKELYFFFQEKHVLETVAIIQKSEKDEKLYVEGIYVLQGY